MLRETFVQALHLFSSRLAQHGVPWAVVGSTNLALQGIEVQPRDIDVVVRLVDLERVRAVFSPESPSSTRTIDHPAGEPTHEFSFTLDGVPVQVLAEQSRGPYAAKLRSGRVTTVQLGEAKIPCFALDAEAEVYEETGRPEKAQRIRAFLSGQPK